MGKLTTIPFAQSVILTLAEIKAASEAFDRGESNAFDAMDAILVAVEAYQDAMRRAATHASRRRDAA